MTTYIFEKGDHLDKFTKEINELLDDECRFKKDVEITLLIKEKSGEE